ncbi:MAG TPA: peptidoglycan DD-metalloendopeptidase family protein, partial [Solirubrobacteraceae bacterium]|nr:peptidoglycan DD-metalloendopeptidase family protein [Solirubrobacteraceae bacterium]
MRLRVLIACLLAPVLLWAILPLPSSGRALTDRLEEKRNQIERKRGTERVLSSDIARWTRRINGLEERIGGLQARQRRIQADLDAKKAELVRLQTQLRDERARLTRLRARLTQTRRMLALRLVEIYKADKPDVLTVVLNSDGFADLLERGEFIQRIAEADRKIVTAVSLAKRDSEETEARLDRLERRQQQVTAIVLRRRNEVHEVKMELIGTRVGLENTRAGKANALQKVRHERVHLEEDLEAMERQQARIQGQLAGAPAPIRQGSGVLIWPVNGAFTSPFGMRWGRLHAGIDIAVATGTPIRAADSGRVALAGWMGGYGQYTCIQHGGALSTCYAHQSSIGVSVGQSVSKGQVIGAVGNTGNSTGPHLHFETRINGRAHDPEPYLRDERRVPGTGEKPSSAQRASASSS